MLFRLNLILVDLELLPLFVSAELTGLDNLLEKGLGRLGGGSKGVFSLLASIGGRHPNKKIIKWHAKFF